MLQKAWVRFIRGSILVRSATSDVSVSIGNKIITTGGGGMVAGNDVKSLEHIKFLVNQARRNKNGLFSSGAWILTIE